MKEEMVRHLEETGWQRHGTNWKKAHWKDYLITYNYEGFIGEWQQDIRAFPVVWKRVERDRELKEDQFYVANLRKAYQQQLKLDRVNS